MSKENSNNKFYIIYNDNNKFIISDCRFNKFNKSRLYKAIKGYITTDFIHIVNNNVKEVYVDSNPLLFKYVINKLRESENQLIENDLIKNEINYYLNEYDETDEINLNDLSDTDKSSILSYNSEDSEDEKNTTESLEDVNIDSDSEVIIDDVLTNLKNKNQTIDNLVDSIQEKLSKTNILKFQLDK